MPIGLDTVAGRFETEQLHSFVRDEGREDAHRVGAAADTCEHGLRQRTEKIRHDLLRFLLECRADGKRVVGYGAPGKGNTLLNYCGIRSDLLEYTVDRNPYKQGRFTPGVRIPIHDPEMIAKDRPDVVIALPWNLEAELTEQLGYISEWGGRLVFPLPALHDANVSVLEDQGGQGK